MNLLEQVFTIIFALIVGASYSKIIDILAERRKFSDNHLFKIFWSIRIHFVILTLFSLILFIFYKILTINLALITICLILLLLIITFKGK